MNENAENVVIEQTEETQDQTPTVEELMAELAKERAANNKLKASFDKAASETAEYKKRLRARQTAEEQAAADQEEARAKREEYIKGLERKVNLTEAKTRYMDLGMDAELAAATAEAELDGDRDVVMENFKKFQDSVLAAKQAEWLKSRPPVQSGGEQKSEDDMAKDAFLSFFK